jgi:hypothetical protein
MFGWQARPCTNLHDMYRWFGVVPQCGFPTLFCVDFSELFVGGVLRMISCGFWWVSRVRFLCLFGW